MKIKQITYQNRRDFQAIFQCEHCGNEVDHWGYDDTNYHNNVIPAMKCEKCGKTAEGKITSEAKDPDWVVK